MVFGEVPVVREAEVPHGEASAGEATRGRASLDTRGRHSAQNVAASMAKGVVS